MESQKVSNDEDLGYRVKASIPKTKPKTTGFTIHFPKPTGASLTIICGLTRFGTPASVSNAVTRIAEMTTARGKG